GAPHAAGRRRAEAGEGGQPARREAAHRPGDRRGGAGEEATQEGGEVRMRGRLIPWGLWGTAVHAAAQAVAGLGVGDPLASVQIRRPRSEGRVRHLVRGRTLFPIRPPGGWNLLASRRDLAIIVAGNIAEDWELHERPLNRGPRKEPVYPLVSDLVK